MLVEPSLSSADLPELDPGWSTLLLIDPLCADVGPMATVATMHLDAAALNECRRQAWGREIYACQAPRRAALVACEHPYLVALLGPSDPWLAWALETSAAEGEAARGDDCAGLVPHALGGLLQYGRDPRAVANDLTALFELHAPPGTSASYLRLADRRTLAWALQIVGVQRLADGLRHVGAWWFEEADGRWMRLAPLPSDAAAAPLRWSPAEWHALAQGEWIHAAVAQWIGREAPAPAAANAPGAFTAAERRSAASAALALIQTLSKQRPGGFAAAADRRAALLLQLQHPRLTVTSWLQALDDIAGLAPGTVSSHQATLERRFTALHTDS